MLVLRVAIPAIDAEIQLDPAFRRPYYKAHIRIPRKYDAKAFAAAISETVANPERFFEVTILSSTPAFSFNLQPQNLQQQNFQRPVLKVAAAAVLVALSGFASAQTSVPQESATRISIAPTVAPAFPAQPNGASVPAPIDFAAEARLSLPDAPGASMTSSSTGSDSDDTGNVNTDDQQSSPATVASNSKLKHSSHFQMTIAPGQVADPMTTHDKVVGGLKDSFSLFAMTGWFASAGYSHWTNGSPNYGTDSGAFAARLGAAAARDSSESVFTECLFAPLFHEDPRYYVMGRGHNFFHRAIYAGTRVLITKSDSGRAVPNFALIAGNASGAALTIPYYPQKNTTFSEVAQTFGGSLGGSAIGYVVTEFIGDALVYAHLKKADN